MQLKINIFFKERKYNSRYNSKLIISEETCQEKKRRKRRVAGIKKAEQEEMARVRREKENLYRLDPMKR